LLATLAGAAERHAEARQAYLDGDSARALTLWTEIAAEEGVSADLLAASGNAEWRLGRKGRAMVCWERALMLDPGNSVAVAGLRHASAVGGVDRPEPRWHETYASWLEVDTWTLVGLASAWTLLLAWALPRQRHQPARCFTQRLRVADPAPPFARSYIHCTRKDGHDPFRPTADRLRHAPGWGFHALDASHSPNITAPEALAALLLELAAA
jgi:hypothetical protein